MDAIHSKELESAEYETMPIFNLQVPKAVNSVPSEVLMPSNMWADKEGYTRSLRHLAELFSKNFETFAVSVSFDAHGNIHAALGVPLQSRR